MQELTVDLEEVIVAGLGGELLGVDNGLLEGIALRGGHFVGKVVGLVVVRWCFGLGSLSTR